MKKILQIVSLMVFTVSAYVPNVQAAPQDITFQILRDGHAFGMHKLDFTPLSNGKIQVDIDINMKFSIGPLTLFRYEHTNTEIWDGNRLSRLQSQTNDDGKDFYVVADWTADAAVIESQNSRYEASSDVLSTSYWNIATMTADQLLNSQKGNIEDITITYKGTEDMVFDWGTVKADVYDVQAAVPIRIMYDKITRQWVGLEFEVRGSKIHYKRLNPVLTSTALKDNAS